MTRPTSIESSLTGSKTVANSKPSLRSVTIALSAINWVTSGTYTIIGAAVVVVGAAVVVGAVVVGVAVVVVGAAVVVGAVVVEGAVVVVGAAVVVGAGATGGLLSSPQPTVTAATARTEHPRANLI